MKEMMMTNKPGLLSRLFGRSKHPVVASLATAALNQPLLVHPAMGEALIGAYLEGAVTSADTELRTDVIAAENIAVLNITGGLVNRPMPGPSGGGPVSYAAVREKLDELLEDDSVGAIVLRIESPGGMASGCFDLVDRIYQARGRKPLHALIDDYAYSAAYAIASACDVIWVSRTGGAGSVGVVAYHHDWSKGNEQIGVKVTPIYAGARKVDFNPNFALTDEAKAEAQADVELLHDLFVKTVARNLGLGEEAVRATEAATYRGQLAVDAGFASRLGTWDELVAELGHRDVPAPVEHATAADDAAAEPEATAQVMVTADGFKVVAGNGQTLLEQLAHEPSPTPDASHADAPPAATAETLATAVAASALPAGIGLALIQRGPQQGEDVAAALEYATAVRDACAAAMTGGESLAGNYIKSNTDLAAVRAQLIALKAEEGRTTQIVTTLPAPDAEKRAAAVKASLNPTTIYKMRGN
jgi:signal peptide peptidase SppA